MTCRNFVSRTFLSLFLTLATFGCAQQNFAPVDVPSIDDPGKTAVDEVSSNFFKLSDSQNSFEQQHLDQNQTAVSFQVRKSDGTYVNDIRSNDLLVSENGVSFTDFKLSSNSQQIVQQVDIVFAVDITGSMTPTIESAKTHLINFVKNSRASGYHTRMCLITFGDYTVQNCNKFYDNNPADPSTEVQVQELISEISKLRALKGSEDPGGLDFNENPMRALIDASKAPWADNSQRFTILITDDGFLYSPGNAGAVGAVAPRYEEVLAALQSSQMRVFAATPSLAGYNLPFKGQPSVVSASKGEFFLFNDLMSGKITLNTILNRILSQVKTTYLLEYISDDIPGLDPSLPITQREIKVVLKNGGVGVLVPVGLHTNLPLGGAQYLKKWKLTDKKIKLSSLKVLIDGVEVAGGFRIENGEIIFDHAPRPGAKISVSFFFDALKDNLRFEPLLLGAGEDLNKLEVLLNGLPTVGPDLVFEKTLEGRWSLRLSERVLSESDPFRILDNGGLSVRIIKKK